MTREEILRKWYENGGVVVNISLVPFALQALMDGTGTIDFIISHYGGNDWGIAKLEKA